MHVISKLSGYHNTHRCVLVATPLVIVINHTAIWPNKCYQDLNHTLTVISFRSEEFSKRNWFFFFKTMSIEINFNGLILVDIFFDFDKSKIRRI